VHTSFLVHALLSSHAVLLALFDHAVVEVAGVQTSQGFVGLATPAA
jgi:hypothetical protein